MKSYSKVVLIIVVSLLFSVATSTVTYSMMRFLNSPDKSGFYLLVISLIISIVLVPVRNYIMNSGCIQFATNHKQKIMEAVVKKNMLFLESPEYGSRINRLKNSKFQDQKFFSAISIISIALGSMIAFCFFLLQQFSILALINISMALLMMALAFLVNYKTSLLMYDFWNEYMNNTRFFNYLSDVLIKKEFIEEKKVFGYKTFFTELFGQEFDKAVVSNKVLGKRRLVLDITNDFLFAFFLLTQFSFLIGCYYNGYALLSFIVSFIPFTIITFTSICASFSAISDLIQIKKFHYDVLDFAMRGQENEPAFHPYKDKNCAIRLENVSFRYPNQDKPVIEDLNLVLDKGKKYALVGVNGSGKTTLTKLIGGFYKPQTGTIYCSSQPSILFQDFNRYPFTVTENIALTETPDENIVMETIEEVGLMEKILSLAENERTELTRLKQNGAELSGGEWQRLALARVLYNKSDIVILDEPTASLDPYIEVEIYNNYMKLLKEQTVIFITHRLGYLRDVDEILVLDNGKFLEHGTHDELMNCNDSIYRKMYEKQGSMYKDEK